MGLIATVDCNSSINEGFRQGDGDVHDYSDCNDALAPSSLVGDDVCCIPYRILNPHCYDTDSSDSSGHEDDNEPDLDAGTRVEVNKDEPSAAVQVIDLEKVLHIKSRDDTAKKTFPSRGRIAFTTYKAHNRFRHAHERCAADNSVTKTVKGKEVTLRTTLFDVGFTRSGDVVRANINKLLTAAEGQIPLRTESNRTVLGINKNLSEKKMRVQNR